MAVLKHFALLLIVCLISTKALAQTDTTFWFAAPAISVGHADRPIVMRLSSYASASTVTISEPANPSFVAIVVDLLPYSAKTIDLTNFIAQIESEPHNTVLNFGLKISATSNISAYYEVEGKAGSSYNNPELFPLKGAISKGLNFMIPGQLQFDNRNTVNPRANSGFVIVATEDNTVIDITPSKDAVGHTANNKFSIVLNKGQSYSVIASSQLGAQHLVGSIVSANKPVCITIYDDSIGPPNSSYDLVGDQIVPEDANGKEFILIKGELNVSGSYSDHFNILAITDKTDVFLDGATTPVITLNRGQVYSDKLFKSSLYIKTSNPVYLNQLTGTGNEMTFTNVPSIHCTGSTLVSFVRSVSSPFYLNLLCKKESIDSFYLNDVAGIIKGSMFSVVTGTNGQWMFAHISTANLPLIDVIIPANETATRVSNTNGLFQLGFLNGGTTSGSVLGYFSNYAQTQVSPVAAGLQCTGNTINLTSTLVVGATYQWTGPNNFSSTLYNPTLINISPINSGSYKVAANILGCGTFTDSVLVTVHPIPTVSISPSDSICLGQTKYLQLNLTGDGPWMVGYSDGNKLDTLLISATPYILTVKPTITTTYTLKSITDANSCTAASLVGAPAITSTVKVNANPVAKFGRPIQVCTPSTANFTDSSTISDGTTASFKWLWRFGDGSIDSVKNPIHIYTNPLSAQVQLLVTSLSGCADSLTKTLPIYSKPIASFQVDSALCLRTSLNITDKSDALGNTLSKWYWRFENGAIDTLQTPIYTYPTIGNKTIQLVVTNNKGCASDTASKQAIVNPLPTALFSLSSPLCEKSAITFTDQSIANAGTLTKWYWDFKDGSTKDTTSAAVFNKTYSNAATYPVRLTVQSSNGCISDTLVKNVVIKPVPTVGFVLPKVCLSDAFAIFTDTTRIADGSEAQFSYLWNFNAGIPAVMPAPSILTSTVKNPSVKYNKSDNYQVSLTVTSKDGCAINLTKAFTVNGSIPKSSFVIQKPSSLCSNDTVRIQNKSTVDFGIVTRIEIIWDFVGAPSLISVDDNPYLNKIYAHRYPDFQTPSTKIYSIRFIAYSGSASSCSDFSEQSITVNQSPKVGFTIIPGICLEATARQIVETSFNASVPGSFSYSGVGVSSTGLFNPQTAGVGTYSIQYLYSSNKGCMDSATQSITVWPSPIAKWTVASIACEKNDLAFTDSSVANYSNIIKRNWDFGDGVTAIKTNSNGFNYVYASANTYTTKLVVQTDSGCISIVNTQFIKVNPQPKPNFNLPNICLPDGRGQFNSATTITDGTEALFSYRWNFNDPNDPSGSTLANPIHRFSALGPYTIQLIVRSNNNCVDSLSQVLTSVYPQPKANFSSTPTEICVNEMIQFQDLSDGKTSAVTSWFWDFSRGNISTQQNPKQKFTDSGSYPISLHVYNAQGCVSDTVIKTTVIHPYPILDLGPDLKVLQDGEISLKPKFIFGNQLSYLWTPAQYLNNDTAAIPISKPLDDITYQLKLTGIGGCTVTDQIFVEVLKAPQVPNAFSPNGDGINDTWKIKYLDSYPGCTIDVFNRYGQKVFSSAGYATEWDGKLNGKTLPIGTYYYILNPKNGRALISGSVTIIL